MVAHSHSHSLHLTTVLPFLLLLLLFFPWSVSSQLVILDTAQWGPQLSSVYGVTALNLSLNGTFPPYNSQLPVFQLASVITQASGYATYAHALTQVYPFYLDVINAHGGININGTHFHLSLTMYDDDGSTELQRLIYEVVQNNSYPLLVAAFNDLQVQSQQPPVEQETLFVYNLYPLAVPSFLNANPYVITGVTTASTVCNSTLTLLNERAQLYFEQVSNGQVTVSPGDSSYISPYGITTMCLYVHNSSIDSTADQECDEVRRWMNETNTARLLSGATPGDLLQLVVDLTWSFPDDTDGDVSQYTQDLSTCPEDVDVLFLCGDASSDDTDDFTTAMVRSGVLPKSAVCVCSMNPVQTVPQNWEGWIGQTAQLPVTESTLSDVQFSSTDDFESQWTAYHGPSLPLVPPHEILTGLLEVLSSVLSNTQGTSKEELRSAFSALHGETFSTPVLIDPTTGNNIAVTVDVMQVLPSGFVVIKNASQLVYPYAFPLSVTEPGVRLSLSQDNTIVLLSTVVLILGCWVAQILLEQAAFVRRTGGHHHLWLCIVAVSMGTAGIWCGLTMQATAVTTNKIKESTSLPMEFSLDVILLGLLPSLLLCWLGLAVMMSGIEDKTQRQPSKSWFRDPDRVSNQPSSAVSSPQRSQLELDQRVFAVREAEREKGRAKRKQAALSHHAHIGLLIHSFDFRVVLSTVILSGAIMLTRVVLWYSWLQQAHFHSAFWCWCVSLIVLLLVMPISLILYFHGMRCRVAGVFVLSWCVVTDWQIQLTGMSFIYELAVLDSPSSLYTIAVSQYTVQLFTGIVAATITLLFVSLQFSRMQLSRNDLALLVANLENVLHKQEKQVLSLQQGLLQERQQLDCMAQMLDVIHLLCPFPQDYAYLLATEMSMDAFRTVWADAAVSNRSPASISTGTMIMRNGSVDTPAVPAPGSRPTSSRAHPVALATRSASCSESLSVTAPIASPTDVQADEEAEHEELIQTELQRAHQPPLININKAQSITMISNNNHSHNNNNNSNRSSTRKTVWTEQGANERRLSGSKSSACVLTLTVAAKRDSDPLIKVKRKDSIHINSTISNPITSNSNNNNSSTGSNNVDQPGAITRRSLIDQASSALSAVLHHSSSHSHMNALTAFNTAAWKTYEDNLQQAIFTQQTQEDNNTQQHTQLSSTNRRASSVVYASHPLVSSSLLLLYPHSASLPTLTLHDLLSHPLCIELLKDEFYRLHCVENLLFYLHARRYRCMTKNNKVRAFLAVRIYNYFIRENAEQQINISTKQRSMIAAVISKNAEHEEASVYSADLFRDSEQEVYWLMESNCMKPLMETAAYRLCRWIKQRFDLKQLLYVGGGGGGAAERQHSSQPGRIHPMEIGNAMCSDAHHHYLQQDIDDTVTTTNTASSVIDGETGHYAPTHHRAASLLQYGKNVQVKEKTRSNTSESEKTNHRASESQEKALSTGDGNAESITATEDGWFVGNSVFTAASAFFSRVISPTSQRGAL